MSSFRKTLLVLAGLALLLSPSVLAQESEVFGGFGSDQGQSRNLAAGSVNDPGSQLLYIIDTGANLRAEVGANLNGYTGPLSLVDHGENLAPNPFGIGGEKSVYNDDGTVNRDRINLSFITITNTHPTQAVTVHFRYFNDECLDVLDFLVLLTCNDTLIFDPFNYQIPGTSFNTVNRIFGPSQGLLDPITAQQFASGRFLIFATASGTSYEPGNTGSGSHDDEAEFRFPHEFDDFVSDDNHCDNLVDEFYFGLSDGIVPDNLHVFNASAVAFNYLIGSWSNSRRVGEGAPVFQTYALNAWTRPAVDLEWDGHGSNATNGNGLGLPSTAGSFFPRTGGEFPDGDGPPLLGPAVDEGGNDFRILTGSESVPASGGSSATIMVNDLYLRNEAHGGDTSHSRDFVGNSLLDYDSFHGALGNSSLFGNDPSDQLFHFLSVVDDYNGSKTGFSQVGGVTDRSFNLTGARTTYVLQAYDRDENIFDVVEDTPINISPPPFEGATAELKIVVDCLRVWVTTNLVAATSVDDLSIEDLGIIAQGLLDHLTKPGTPTEDASTGWIRFVRDNTEDGSWVEANSINDASGTASFTTIAYQVVRSGGFAGAWWLSAVAADPLVSETGDPQCDGACPEGAGRRTN